MKFFSACLLILIAGFTHAADLKSSRPDAVGMSAERLDRIKPIMQAYIDNNQLVGITTVIARRGKVVHNETVGVLNRDTGEPLKPDSLFRIYSMTKPVVSVALMQLYEQGKFQLDDPVEQYLPAFKDAKVLVDGELVEASHAFTIRELLSHSAGLTYGVFGRTEVDKLYREALLSREKQGFDVKDVEDMVQRIGKLPLLYQPGTRWVYSLSADVVGRLVEVISGQPLDVYFHEALFKPLKMNDTFFEVPKEKLHRFGTNHTLDKDGKLIVMDKPETSNFANKVTFFSGGGGLVGSAPDYLRFAQMLLNGGVLDGKRILSPKTVELMTMNHLADDVKSGFGERPGVAGTFGFGLGFGIATAKPRTSPGSQGEYTWGGAAGTIFWIDPQEQIIGLLMVQQMRNRIDLRQQFKVLTYQAVAD